MAENKTRPTDASVQNYLGAITDPIKRADCGALLEMMGRLSGYEPVLWGAMVGFGRYAYRYDSGRSGEMFRLGLAARKTNLTLYIVPGFGEFTSLLERLGKHSVGKSCLYVKRLADIDRDVLEDMIVKSLERMESLYPSAA